MNQELPEDHITKKTVACVVEGLDAVAVQRDLEYSEGESGPLTFDLYRSEARSSAGALGAVILCGGYPDPGMKRLFGCHFKDWGASTSWARLIAATGLVAVTYTNHDPVASSRTLLAHLRLNASDLGLDRARLGLFASSGHGPLALSLLIDDKDETPLRCAGLFYPFTLDLDGASGVSSAAATFRFTNPTEGRSITDLPTTPLFLARAGRDQMPGLNHALDRFVTRGLERNLPMTLVNHAEGEHAFDLTPDPVGDGVVRSALSFFRSRLARHSPGR